MPMSYKKCWHNRIQQFCRECAMDGTGGASICNKKGHEFARKHLCVACAKEGTGGKGICKAHGLFMRISRCPGCKKNTELCRHVNFKIIFILYQTKIFFI